MFSGGRERVYWQRMGQVLLVLVNINSANQRPIQNPVYHLRLNVLQKQLMAITVFAKRFIFDV